MIRWTDVRPGTTGNGHIYYAGMDNNGGGTPTFFDGDTAGIPPSNPGEHTKYITYPQTNMLSSSQASYDAKTGVITMHIPLADVGNPADGAVLYSATAFSATSASPQSAANLFNLIDATTPFELVIGPPGFVGSSSAGGSSPRSGGDSVSQGVRAACRLEARLSRPRDDARVPAVCRGGGRPDTAASWTSTAPVSGPAIPRRRCCAASLAGNAAGSRDAS